MQRNIAIFICFRLRLFDMLQQFSIKNSESHRGMGESAQTKDCNTHIEYIAVLYSINLSEKMHADYQQSIVHVETNLLETYAPRICAL